MLKNEITVMNIEDLVVSPTTATLVRYSSNVVTLNYKVKSDLSDYPDVSYTNLSNTLIKSIVNGYFNALLRKFGNNTSLYECTSDTVTTIDLLQGTNKDHPSNDVNNDSRLSDSTITVIIITVMMCLLVTTGGIYYYYIHVLANVDSTTDHDSTSEFILHDSIESCIHNSYRYSDNEPPAIVANPLNRQARL